MADLRIRRFHAALRPPSVFKRQKRIGPMFDTIRTFFRGFHVPTRAELERDYLNGAANRVDLEFRQRQVDRGLFRLDA